MENNEYIFDEEKAISFIRKEIPNSVSEKYSDDEILFVIDTVWDYYESNGLLDINSNVVEDEETDPEKLIRYVKKEVKKDKELMMDPEDIGFIVQAELDYEESLEDFV